jgi:hypothetical protein
MSTYSRTAYPDGPPVLASPKTAVGNAEKKRKFLDQAVAERKQGYVDSGQLPRLLNRAKAIMAARTPEALVRTAPVTTNQTRSRAMAAAQSAAMRVRAGQSY